MDITQQIQDQIKNNPVLLYMKGNPDFPMCGFSSRAVDALHRCGLREFAHVNVLEEPEIRAQLPQVSQWPTFPQLYVKGELVGGSDIIADLLEQGELQKLLDGLS